MNFYNENDPKAAAWLRELIKEGHIPPGVVDERSITEIKAHELTNFTQCHFFAGIGGWSYALRLAGWPDDQPVWTGSCPCQPLSCAGQRKGHADERHLWPTFYRLIAERQPPTIFGEQVASPDGREWFSGIRADMEGTGYAVGGADLCAAGVSAPHSRQRLYWVADAKNANRRRELMSVNTPPNGWAGFAGNSEPVGLGITHSAGRQPGRQGGEAARHGDSSESAGGACRMGDTSQPRLQGQRGFEFEPKAKGRQKSERHDTEAGRLGNHWSDYDICHFTGADAGKTRRIEPASLTVVDGIPSLMGIDREEGYGTLEEEITAYADAQKIRPGEAMRLLWLSLVEETIRSDFGGQISFSSPPILLSFLRELSHEGWAFSEGILCAGKKTKEELLRSVWWQKVSSRPSCERGLERQYTDESPDALRVLSSILARYVETHWGEAVYAYADHGFPLASNVIGRMGLLRGYGNTIVPQVAAEFIQAYLETL